MRMDTTLSSHVEAISAKAQASEGRNTKAKFEENPASNLTEAQGFVAVNFITTQPDYAARMENLFQTRAGFIDHCKGFRKMQVLRPREDANEYLVISEWDSEADFQNWTQSAEFQHGHRRAFDDLAHARKHNACPPMISNFSTYDLIESS